MLSPITYIYDKMLRMQSVFFKTKLGFWYIAFTALVHAEAMDYNPLHYLLYPKAF